MAKCYALVFGFILTLLLHTAFSYDPTWESLDSRPIPSWYDDSKLGIFIHWGVFSVPSYSSEWFWWNWKGEPTPAILDFMATNYKPDFTYADFAEDFTAEFFDASEWIDIFKSSGAKYIVFVSKHHEGFTNWPSKYSFNWNSAAVGPNRDIVGELMNATLQKSNLRFGLYHSMFEWFHPLYIADKNAGYKTQDFVTQKTLPELYEIVNTYKPDVVWSDGDWDAPDSYWNSKEFLAWLYTDSPVKDSVVVNDRWGHNISCHHGGFYTCGDRYNPGVLQKHKWENAMTIDKYSWGFRRNARLADYLTIEELLQTFIITVSCGGNMLMNVGPPKHGHIDPIYEERLRQLGSWLQQNGDGIYSTQPWTYQNDTLTPNVWYTLKKATTTREIYAFVFNWPSSKTLTLGSPQTTVATTISLLGYPGYLSFNTRQPSGIDIIIPDIPISKMPNTWLWTFKITAVAN